MIKATDNGLDRERGRWAERGFFQPYIFGIAEHSEPAGRSEPCRSLGGSLLRSPVLVRPVTPPAQSSPHVLLGQGRFGGIYLPS